MPTQTFCRLRDEKQEGIMRSAVHEFVNNGFARATVSDIAKGAGVAKGSMFQYFENKEEIFVYCAKWCLEVFMKKLDKHMDLGEMDVFEYLQDNSAISEILLEEQELSKFMFMAINEPGLLDESSKGMYDIGNVYTKRLIENSKKRGTVRNDVGDELLLTYFSAVTGAFNQRWLALYMAIGEEIDPEKEKTMISEKMQMLELIKKGMGC